MASTKTKSRKRASDRGRGGKFFPSNPPNDADLRETTRKRNHCQRCDAAVKLTSQKHVAHDDEGVIRVTRASKTGNHYCADCAKIRRNELKRFDERMADEDGKAPKKAAKPKKPAKATGKAKPRKRAPSKKAAAVKAKAKKAAGSSADPF